MTRKPGVTAPRSIDHLVIVAADLDQISRVFEDLGFTLTPRAHHPWGTDNRLIQLGDRSFLELLEISRPALISEPDDFSRPPQFSFGAFNRDFLAGFGPGISMLALTGGDAPGDARRFAADGLGDFAPFSFGRLARQPDGQDKEVAFDLAFARHPEIPHPAYFTCHNKFPENFWKSRYQRHPNGARGLAGVSLTSEAPDKLTPFLSKLAGCAPIASPASAGRTWALGPHRLELASGAPMMQGPGTKFSALSISVADLAHCRALITENQPGIGLEPTEHGFRLLCEAQFGFSLAFQPAANEKRSR